MALRLAGRPAFLVGASDVAATVDFLGGCGWIQRRRVALPREVAEALYGVDAAEAGRVSLEEVELAHDAAEGRLLVLGPLGGPAAEGAVLGLPVAADGPGPDGLVVAEDPAFGARVVCRDPDEAAAALEAAGAARRERLVAIPGDWGPLRLALIEGTAVDPRAGSVVPVLALRAGHDAVVGLGAEPTGRGRFDQDGNEVEVVAAALPGGLVVQLRATG
jgi:hypothetical protein